MSQIISVIICTLNRDQYLKRSLQCLKEQDLVTDLYEIIIVDNNSNDKTKSVCTNFQSDNPSLDCRYVLEKTSGLSFARNRGIMEAKGNIIVFIDDDAMASKSYLTTIHSYFSRNENVFAGGGKIIPEYETDEPDWMSKYLLPLVSALDMGDEVKIFPSKKYPIGANMFFRKSFFKKYGTFNTDLGRKGNILLGSEEKDVFKRIKDKQSIVYLPDAYVKHVVPAKRLELEYIDDIAKGVGKSEYIRSKSSGTVFSMYTNELIKWGGSILLFIFYLFRLNFSKGSMIIRFRYFVSKAMLTAKQNDTENSKIFD